MQMMQAADVGRAGGARQAGVGCSRVRAGAAPAGRGRQQAGFSLIEILVAVVLLSVGMLGMLMAQTRAMQYARTAELRTVATQFANDLVDRIRANSRASHAYAMDDASRKAYYPASRQASYRYQPERPARDFPAPNPDCDQASCSAEQMAQHDLATFRRRVRESLPGGDIFVAWDDDHGVLKVWVIWQQPGNDEQDSAGMSYSTFCPPEITRVDPVPQCLPVGVVL